MALRQKLGEDNPCYCCGSRCPSISEFIPPVEYGEEAGEKNCLWLYCSGCDPALEEADDSDGFLCPCGADARYSKKALGYAMAARYMYDEMVGSKPTIAQIVTERMKDKYGPRPS